MTNDNEKKQDILNRICDENIDKDIKNLLSIVKLAKFKKQKANSSEMEFLTFWAKKIFIYQ